jgi:Uma2 family endonuclease
MPVSTTRSKPARSASPADRHGAIPPLESGDRLTREEFERRYHAMPHLKKAELIEGVVYVPSPVRQEYHGGPHLDFNGWLFGYMARTPGLKGGDNSTVRLDPLNEPQPDGVLYIKPEHGGRVVIDEEGYINHAPDLVAEVSASSASYDLHDKLEVYRRHEVREYIVWRVFDREIDWFVLRGAAYERLMAGDDGILRSTIFPGLWLDPGALMREDYETLLAVLQRGLETPEHAAFKEKLQRDKIAPLG